MRKILTALLFLVFPPLSVIVTTPLTSLIDHISHIILFAILGMCMTGYCLKKEITKTATTKEHFKLLPSFITVVFIVLLVFISTHAMPCPYMTMNHSVQKVIDHPCCQPTTPCSPSVSFSPSITKIVQLQIPNPVIHFLDSIQSPDNNSPPSA